VAHHSFVKRDMKFQKKGGEGKEAYKRSLTCYVKREHLASERREDVGVRQGETGVALL
jgi:hypothetical protein